MHIFGYVARNVLFVLFGLIFGYEVSYAQTITIKGQVLDEKKTTCLICKCCYLNG